MFNYLLESEADDLLVYVVPKELFSSPRFSSLTAESKVLYGILLDMVDQAVDEGCVDESDHVYVLYPITAICRDFCCTSEKAALMLKELEQFGLVFTAQERIYVKNFKVEREG